MADNDPAPTGGKKKIPTWYYVIGIGVLAGAYYFYKKNSANAAAAAANTSGATTPSPTDTSGLATDQYEALLSQLRDIQGQESAEAPSPTPTPIPGPMPPTEVGRPAQPTPPRAAPPTAPVKTAPPPPKPRTVTVAPWPAWNSTLWGIAEREYGNPSADTKIWDANQSLIEGQEIKHGMTKAQADQNKWLYPGEVLTIP